MCEIVGAVGRLESDFARVILHIARGVVFFRHLCSGIVEPLRESVEPDVIRHYRDGVECPEERIRFQDSAHLPLRRDDRGLSQTVEDVRACGEDGGHLSIRARRYCPSMCVAPLEVDGEIASWGAACLP